LSFLIKKNGVGVGHGNKFEFELVFLLLFLFSPFTDMEQIASVIIKTTCYINNRDTRRDRERERDGGGG
jgi:hypothetical protein